MLPVPVGIFPFLPDAHTPGQGDRTPVPDPVGSVLPFAIHERPGLVARSLQRPCPVDSAAKHSLASTESIFRRPAALPVTCCLADGSPPDDIGNGRWLDRARSRAAVFL